MSKTYVIEMKNCAFFARHGVFDQEEFLGQRFFVDVEMEVEPGDALETDNIEATVHYGEVFQVVEKIVTGTRRYLIEALAFEIARTICRQFAQVRRTKITVRKPAAPVPGILDYVQVTVEPAC